MEDTPKDAKIADFCRKLPKLELHAHLNGSVSLKTLESLRQKRLDNQFDDTCRWPEFTEFNKKSFSEGFQVFSAIHHLVDNKKAVKQVTNDVIKEFAEDNVKYLELRTTPKSYPKMTKHCYLNEVISAIMAAEATVPEITVRLLISIDRKRGAKEAMENVELANDYQKLTNGIVCGVDLSGDPSANPASVFSPALIRAKEYGLKMSLHVGEISDINDAQVLLDLLPDRIGHGTCLQPQRGGSQQLTDKVIERRIPLELCLTSNVKCGVVPSYKDHHIYHWYKQAHPITLATDDKGVFGTTLSKEYEIMMKTFSLSPNEVWTISYNAIDMVFADDSVKQNLRNIWEKEKQSFHLQSSDFNL